MNYKGHLDTRHCSIHTTYQGFRRLLKRTSVNSKLRSSLFLSLSLSFRIIFYLCSYPLPSIASGWILTLRLLFNWNHVIFIYLISVSVICILFVSSLLTEILATTRFVRSPAFELTKPRFRNLKRIFKSSARASANQTQHSLTNPTIIAIINKGKKKKEHPSNDHQRAANKQTPPPKKKWLTRISLDREEWPRGAGNRRLKQLVWPWTQTPSRCRRYMSAEVMDVFTCCIFCVSSWVVCEQPAMLTKRAFYSLQLVSSHFKFLRKCTGTAL